MRLANHAVYFPNIYMVLLFVYLFVALAEKPQKDEKHD